MLNLDRAGVAKLAANFNVIPVVETLFAGTETPVGVFEKLAANKPGSFLLESAEQGVWARYSFVGVHNRGFLGWTDGVLTWDSAGEPPLPNGGELSSRPLEALDQLQKAWTSANDTNLPPLSSGLVGLIGWNMVREIEHLPNAPESDFKAPDMAFAQFRDLVVFDHLLGNLLLVSNIFVTHGADLDAEYEAALTRIGALRSGLLKPSAATLVEVDWSQRAQIESHRPREHFLEAVERAKEYVRIGDVFQVVLSQRFDLETQASPLEVYSALRAVNPSPYMYLLNFTDANGPYAVVGSSPESLVKVSDSHAVTHPIAGSRPRGVTPEEDVELAEQLQADAKERSEHLMLVDLARNDLLKVCQPSSVSVTEFMQIHRYSHIMHLVSTVEGQIRPDQSPIDVFKATFPAGTLSGAPKPRALEIIDELEPSNRGIYGGVVGYFDFNGNADLAITIRTAFIRDGIAHVQAGAGLVLDSVPETEFAETMSKAGAPARAVTAANSMRRVSN